MAMKCHDIVEMEALNYRRCRRGRRTLLDLHGEDVHLLHPLLQLVLGRGGHRVHVIVTPVVILVGVSVEDLPRSN